MGSIRKIDGQEKIYIPELIGRLWKRKFLILFGALSGAVIFFVVSRFLLTPLYEASITLYVNNNSSKENTSYITQSDLYASSQLVETYAAIILSDSILEDVIDDVSLDMSIDDLADILEVKSVNDTEVFQVIVRWIDPVTAARIVDAVAEIVPEQIAAIVTGSSVTVINYARVPEYAVFPDYLLMVLLGFGVGMVLVVGYLFIREMLDTRIKTSSDFSRWEYPLLASIPYFFDKKNSGYGSYGKKRRGRETSGLEPSSVYSCILTENTPFSVQEAYKTLRTNVLFSSPDEEKRVIVISSALQNETKSTTAINLASAFAQNRSRVLLIDCDLRLPCVASKLGIRQSPGLTEMILDMETNENAIHVMDNGLHVLPSGTVPPNPTEMLGSQKLANILKWLSESYDYIIIDTPPLETMPDAAILSKHATDVILVVRQDKAEKTELDAVIKKLELAQAKILGFVFTCVTEGDGRSYKKYGYRYGYSYQRKYSDQKNFSGDNRKKHRKSK